MFSGAFFGITNGILLTRGSFDWKTLAGSILIALILFWLDARKKSRRKPPTTKQPLTLKKH